MKLRAQFNYDTDEASVESALSVFDKSKTIQSSKDEADINVIVKNFGITGTLPQRNIPALIGDFTNLGDFRSAMDQVRAAQVAFSELPAEVRERFAHDPASFVEFASDPQNLPELRRLKLAPPEAAPAPPAPEPAPSG